MGQFPGCHAYNHNPSINYDLIFARQWRNSRVSGSSIAEFLAKVSDRWWVLEEAKRRIGEELSAAPLLLHFALAITSTPLHEPIPRPAVVWAKVAARQRSSLISSTPSVAVATTTMSETKRGNGEEKDMPLIASATAPLRLNNNNMSTGNTNNSNTSTPTLAPLSSPPPPMSFQLSLAGGTLMDSDICPYGTPLTRLEAHMCLYRVVFLRIQARINTFISLLRAEASDNNNNTNDRDTSTTSNTSGGTSSASASSPAPINPSWFTGSSPTIIGPAGELWSLSMFLQCDLLTTACEFARDENFSAVEALLHGHADELSSERLRIVSSIPETCSPLRYSHLLPRPNAHPLQSQSPPLFADWVDTRDVIKRLLYVHRLQPLKRGAAVSIGHIKRRQIQRRRYLATGASCFTNEALTRWYMERMRVMDTACGQLQGTVSPLCDLAISYHVDGLTEFRTILDDLIILVYEHDLDLSVTQYEALDDFGRLCLVLASSRPDTISHDLRVRAGMFFNPSRVLKLKEAGPPLLHRYILHCASIQRLDMVTAILEQCKSTLPLDEQLISDQEQLLTIALSAVYSSSQMDQKHWTLVSNIFECLPTRNTKDGNARLLALQDRIDLFELHLGAAEILTRHGLSRPLSFFLPLPPPATFPAASAHAFVSSSIGVTLPRLGVHDGDDEVKEQQLIGGTKKSSSSRSHGVHDECRELLKSISRRALRNRSTMSESDWELLLTDVLDLHGKVLWFVPQDDVLLTFCESVLAAAQFAFARRLFALLTGVGGAAAAAAAPTTPTPLPVASPIATGATNDKERKSRTGLFLTSRLKALTSTLGVSKKLFGKSSRNKASIVTSGVPPQSVATSHHPSPSANSGPFSPSLGPSSTTSAATSGLQWVTGAGTAPLPIPKCELVVLRAAREFFNSAPSADHHDLQLAEDCLALLPLPSPFNLSSPSGSGSSNNADGDSVLSSHARTIEWQRELEFIEGVRRLVAMGVKHVVPLQVRLSTSRLDFIKKILELNPHAYQSDDALLGIARCFGLNTIELQCEVRVLLIKAAIARHDAKTAVAGVRSLMEVHRYRAGWRTCQEVSNAIEAIKTKHVLLSHALWSCHINDLDSLLVRWKVLALEREQKEVKASMPLPSAPLVITDDDAPPLSDTELLIIQTLEYRGTSDSLATSVTAADQSCKRRRFAALGLSAAIDGSFTKRAESGAGAAATMAGVTIPPSSTHSMDVSLLRLAEESCFVDSAMCFAYLCSLSQPSLAHDLLQRLLVDTSRRFIDRQHLVQTGLRFFAARAMALHGTALLPATDGKDSKDGKRSSTSSDTSSSSSSNIGVRADTRILSTPMAELEEYVYQLTRRKRAVGPLPKDLELAQVYVTAAMHLRRSELAAKRNPQQAAAWKKAAAKTAAAIRSSLVVKQLETSNDAITPPDSPLLSSAAAVSDSKSLPSPDPSRLSLASTSSPIVSATVVPSSDVSAVVADTVAASITEPSSVVTSAAAIVEPVIAEKPIVAARAPPLPPLELMIATYVTQRQYTTAIRYAFKSAGVHPRMQAMDYGMVLVKKILAAAITSLVQLDICIFASSSSASSRMMQRSVPSFRLPLSYTLHEAKIALHITSSDMPAPSRQQWSLVRPGAGPSLQLDNDHATLASYGVTSSAAIEVDISHDHGLIPFVLSPAVDYTRSLKELLDAAQATIRVDGL